MHISQDLYGYEGNLTCLCLCLSCSTKASNQRAVVPVRSKVVSTLINVHVWGPQTSTTVVEKKKSNGATVAAILLGLIATVLAVCLTVMCVRKYWLAREEEVYRVETLDNELYRVGHDSELEVPVDVDIGVMKAVERVQ
ncbi:hypothetical protein DQ04_08351000 [Trypanosoma grayi]|uniref:hypothetical protein n=1 Tax=Trypanosoma grayi TaxID=71804 RepID=UPI0004F44847|nr:hypothetical protein DQ04_08351000 [Trypanosoma grayi]KEG07967.1 hypothetical protein DQ04_08351000 [Trypanosoma grayi]